MKKTIIALGLLGFASILSLSSSGTSNSSPQVVSPSPAMVETLNSTAPAVDFQAQQPTLASPTPSPTISPKPSPTPSPKSVPAQQPTTYDSYINSQGNEVQSPTYYESEPEGATAECRDGTYSFSQSRRGTCSGHGGVARWL